MKEKLLIIIGWISITGHSQTLCSMYYNFGSPDDFINLSIDTIQNPDNIWQVGSPQKTVFTGSLGPAAIVTDTLNTYPVNDTSSFIITHVACDGFAGMGIASISTDYKVHSDSLNDYGKIEFSPDNGLSWVLISDDTTIYNAAPWPTYINAFTLTGISDDWGDFAILLYNLPEIFGVTNGDSVLFRFTFISDGIFDAMDGLMFDNILITDEQVWGIEDLNNQKIVINPNPAQNFINVTYDADQIGDSYLVELFDFSGRYMKSWQGQGGENSLDISDMSSGVYLLKITSQDGKVRSEKLVIENQ